jgi:3'-phosphoadenosine 5'-phosphosulfate sulfotransferase (PAPS reductase)/FAD synthetase
MVRLVIPLAELRRSAVAVSVSGGKDSAATGLHLRELEIPHRRVFADTGWEHPATYDYLRGELARVLGPVEEVRGPHLMADLVRKKGMFPGRTRRFCTSELKAKPLNSWARAAEVDVIALGIRAAESAKRATMAEWEWSLDADAWIWRPLLAWSEADVIAIHRRHGLRPNPLYLAGASRVGCYPCIFSRKGEVRRIADTDPGRIAEIRALEAEVDAASLARHAARGEDREAVGHGRPTFFQAPIREAGAWPIDRVVTWARTAHGGRQLELFDPPGGDGCARWGMCESNPDEGEG